MGVASVVAQGGVGGRGWSEQGEWSRKEVHIETGPVVLIAGAMGIGQGVALPAAALVTVLTALNHRYRLLPAVEDVGRHSYGTIAYGAAITILLALFWPQQPLPVAAGVLVMALGDGLAGLIGPQIPSIRWQVLGQTKSLAGTGAMAAASLLALGGLTALASGLGLAAPSWPSLLLLTGVAAGLEQLSRYGGDNLTVPLATGMLWQQLSG